MCAVLSSYYICEMYEFVQLCLHVCKMFEWV